MIDKAVIIEYDFAAINGASLLFSTAERFLRELDGIVFDDAVEAKYFAGREYLEGFSTYFPIVKTKKTALKASRDLDAGFRKALVGAINAGVPQGFVDFVRLLVSRQVKVVISTRADVEQVAGAFSALPGHGITYHHEEAQSYGSIKRDRWRMLAARYRLRPYNVVAVTGSGLGSKAALLAGLGSVAVMNPRTAYQDYSGCNELFESLDAAAAKRVLEILKVPVV